MLGVREQTCRMRQKFSSKVMYVFPKKKPETVTTIEYHLRVKTMALFSKKEKKKEQENSHLDPQNRDKRYS